MMEEQAIRLIDIYDLSYNPWWLSSWFRLLLFVAVIGSLIAGAVVLYLRYRRRKKTPYWQQALNQIVHLKEIDFDDGQAFYLQLTEIIKNYLQQRYHIAVVDKTDIELLDLLKNSTVFPERVYVDLKDIFEGVTFIKFAHQTAAQERMLEAIQKSLALIQATHQEVEKKY